MSCSEEMELVRVAAMHPTRLSATNIFGEPFYITDGKSFAHLYDLYFKKRTYSFRCKNHSPFIIDCGANIGVGIKWWKQEFPSARVLAFEADPDLFQILTRNCAHLPGVELVNAAVWDGDGTLPFSAKGGEGGHVAELCAAPAEGATIAVRSARFRNLLGEHCDLLKMDIEGAEARVIRDCANALAMVDRVFVEFHSFFDREQYLGETITHLENAGFRIHANVELPSPQPFQELLEFNQKDLRLDLFCFREPVRPTRRVIGTCMPGEPQHSHTSSKSQAPFF